MAGRMHLFYKVRTIDRIQQVLVQHNFQNDQLGITHFIERSIDLVFNALKEGGVSEDTWKNTKRDLRYLHKEVRFRVPEPTKNAIDPSGFSGSEPAARFHVYLRQSIVKKLFELGDLFECRTHPFGMMHLTEVTSELLLDGLDQDKVTDERLSQALKSLMEIKDSKEVQLYHDGPVDVASLEVDDSDIEAPEEAAC